MTIRLLILCAFGLSLVSCDRPEATGSGGAAADPSAPAAPQRHAIRQPKADAATVARDGIEEASRLEAPEERDKALAEIAWNAIETHPEIALEAMLRLPAGGVERIRLIQHHAMRLAGQDLEQAIAWAGSLESPVEASAAMAQIALTIAETDPHRAAGLLSESGIEGRDFDVALVQVIQRWAAGSAPDAAAWVAMFPPGAAREASVRAVAERWLPGDAAAAFRWLEGIGDEGFRRETARAMQGVIIQQPEAVRETWLGQASAGVRAELERQREQALEDVGDNVPRTPE